MDPLDPHSWDSDMDTLRVGDPFTEAWIDRFRALMLAYNAAIAALKAVRDDAAELGDQVTGETMRKVEAALAKSESPR